MFLGIVVSQNITNPKKILKNVTGNKKSGIAGFFVFDQCTLAFLQ